MEFVGFRKGSIEKKARTLHIGMEMELNYNSATSIKAFLEDRGLGMRKKFGQNFMINPSTRQELAGALDASAGETVWEIGPGLGAMTRILLEKGLAVRAFEIDLGFARALGEIFAGEQGFELVEGDALKTWRTQPPAQFLFGNLPYNIGATLLADFIESGLRFKRIVVTVQREVARRMVAGVGGTDYSSFSVLCSSAYSVKPLMVIKGASFYPKPNVDSQGVLFELREDATAKNLPALFYPLVRGLFSARRKTIKNNLAAFFGESEVQNEIRQGSGGALTLATKALAKSGVDGRARAENLCVEDFAALAKTIEDIGL